MKAIEYLRVVLAERATVHGALSNLSRAAGVSTGYLGDILHASGERQPNPTLSVLDRIAEALGMEVPEIFAPAKTETEATTSFTSPTAPQAERGIEDTLGHPFTPQSSSHVALFHIANELATADEARRLIHELPTLLSAWRSGGKESLRRARGSGL